MTKINPFRKAFGERVAEVRTAAGMSQLGTIAALEARGVHLAASALSKVEHGTRPTTADDIQALAWAWGVRPGDLFPGGAFAEPGPTDYADGYVRGYQDALTRIARAVEEARP